jgi:predicted dehydrogenase
MGQKIQKSSNPIRVGLFSSASIAINALISPAEQLPDVVVFAVATRNRIKSEEFAEKYSIHRVYDAYENLLTDPEIDAIYIPLPNSLHFEWAKNTIKHGKHVLLERPLTSNAEEAQELFNLGSESSLVIMEDVHYRYHPATVRVKNIIVEELGTVISVTVEIDHPQILLPGNLDTDIRFKSELAGGATMDLGYYAVNAIRYFGGSEISEVTSASATLHDTDKNIDLAMNSSMLLQNGGEAKISSGYMAKFIPTYRVEVKAENGILVYTNFLLPHAYHDISVTFNNGSTRSETCYGNSNWTSYTYQLDAFALAVRKVKEGDNWQDLNNQCPTLQDALNTMRVIDKIYVAAGMRPRMKYQRSDQ